MTTATLEVYCDSHLLMAAFEDESLYQMTHGCRLFPQLAKAMDAFLNKHADMTKIEARFIDLGLDTRDNYTTFIIEYNPNLVTEDMDLDKYESDGFNKLDLFPVLCAYAN